LIPQSFIQELLNRVDVVDVVGRYVKLKKAGANFSGLCPFHNEKSPSFTVSPTKQFYHCFGCGAHGTAIGFLMEYSGLSFPEAVHDLAQSQGMVVPDEDDRLTPEQKVRQHTQSISIHERLAEAMAYYRAQLKLSERAIDYLKGRGLTGVIAARFGLGYAPNGWQNLALAVADYEDPIWNEAGLVVDRQDEGGAHKRYDRFRDRIMFPIRNARGQVIGFGGRILDTGEPKYLNSPETPVFQKGLELYGLFEARSGIREEGYAIVVEGYMDVVALHQLDFGNAVATLGTACTPAHVQKLIRQTDRVVFSFDGDAAGRKAAWRALEASLPHAQDNKSFTFLFLPPEHDPDSYVREFGQEAFAKEIQSALPLSEFLLREVALDKDLQTAEGRARMLFDAKPLLRALPAGALRLQIVREMARLAHCSTDEVHAIAELAPIVQHRAPPRSRRAPPSPIDSQIMRLLLNHPRHVFELGDAARAVLARHPLPAMAVLVAACWASPPGATLASLSEVLLRGPEGELFAELVRQALEGPESDRQTALDDLKAAVVKLRIQQIRAEMDELAAQASSDPFARTRYQELTEELTGEQRSLQPEAPRQN
jgi:DNA primase